MPDCRAETKRKGIDLGLIASVLLYVSNGGKGRVQGASDAVRRSRTVR